MATQEANILNTSEETNPWPDDAEVVLDIVREQGRGKWFSRMCIDPSTKVFRFTFKAIINDRQCIITAKPMTISLYQFIEAKTDLSSRLPRSVSRKKVSQIFISHFLNLQSAWNIPIDIFPSSKEYTPLHSTARNISGRDILRSLTPTRACCWQRSTPDSWNRIRIN